MYYDSGHSDFKSRGIINTRAFSEGALSGYFRAAGTGLVWKYSIVRYPSVEVKSKARQICVSPVVFQQMGWGGEGKVGYQSLAAKIMVIPLCGYPGELKDRSHCSFKYLLIMLKARIVIRDSPFGKH